FNNDLWVKEAIKVTKIVLNNFLEKFIKQPYLHRVEHSIHCDLYNMLYIKEIFNKKVNIGNEAIQIIHKEWPEFIPRPEKGNRRGNFDMAILSPNNSSGNSLNDFINGRIEAPIVIEMGLNYDIEHLIDDLKKLKNSEVYCGYLIHLVRKEQNYEYKNFEEILLEIEKKYPSIGVGYVKHQPGRIRYKLIGDDNVSFI
ncbi:hypothetical protein ACFLQQ_04785, partial [Actinomycetota bacterium]